MDTDFDLQIQPFFWIDREQGSSLALAAGRYKQELFDSRAERNM